MSRLLKLIQNEQAKLFIRKSTWIMYIILIGIIIAGAFLTDKFSDLNEDYQGDDWRQVLQEDNKKLQQEMKKDEYAQAINPETIAKNNYYLEHDIQPAPYTAWNFVQENAGLLTFVSLLTIIIAGGIIANEFRWGSIKLLLIRPIRRSGILLSKYIATLLFSLYTTIFVFLFSWMVGAIFFGVGDLNPEIVKQVEDGFTTVSLLKETLTSYGFQIVPLVMMATFAFMISAVFRNSSLAIGISIFLMMGGSSVMGFLAQKEWAKYILFAHMDLSQYTAGNTPMIKGMTLEFSIVMLLIYYVIFIALSWMVFTKRDVAGQ
ncbi:MULTISPECIES: ABC transporter permease [Clostridia]|uniref:ABC transporter permease n=1 Tax=Clostridia TaxID=186801 RepID=UPI000EA0D29F|nr:MULTISPECIES: ABC transporter permease [Clostridia]NBJ70092.1 ABC transporter permease [Roseburia sp. 1XD42-34]RKI77265.1 ABC transporter permease [Clostridium sp. 1xD42-85]